MPEVTEEVPRPMDNPASLPGGGYEPPVPIKDIDRDGVDVAVCLPSFTTSLSCLEDIHRRLARFAQLS